MEDLFLPPLGAATVIGVLWNTTRDKYLLIPITFFALVVLFTCVLIQVFYFENCYYTYWAVGGVGLIVSYTPRFRRKAQHEVIDYFKLASIFLLSLYLFRVEWVGLDPYFQEGYMYTIITIISLVYIYDRFKLTSMETSKGKFVIALVVQSVVLVLFLVYSFVQRTQAIKQREYAVDAQKQAEENLKALEECQQGK